MSEIAMRSQQHREAPSGLPVLVCGVEIHPRVVSLCAQKGIDLADLIRCLRHPETIWPAQTGSGMVSLKGAVAVITTDTGEVVAITSRARALAQRQQPRTGALRRTRGGSGGHAPTTIPALLQRLRDAGCEILDDRRHYIARHPDRPGAQVVIPKTPSDPRSIPNTAAQVRRVLGVDLRQ